METWQVELIENLKKAIDHKNRGLDQNASQFGDAVIKEMIAHGIVADYWVIET